MDTFAEYLKNIEKWYFYSNGEDFGDYVIYFENTWRKKGQLYGSMFFSIGLKDFHEKNKDDKNINNLFWYAALCVSRLKDIISRKDWPALSVPVRQLEDWRNEFHVEIKLIVDKELSRRKSKAAKSRYLDLDLLKNKILDYLSDHKEIILYSSISRFLEKHTKALNEIVEPFRERWKLGNSSYMPPDRDNLVNAIFRWRSDDDNFRVGMDEFFNLKMKPKSVVLENKK
nr:hypothetical protein [uncultured Albidiferax sp.]